MKKIKAVLQSIRNWYIGKPYENELGSSIFFVGMVRPTLAIKFDAIIFFIRAEWKWLVGTALTILGLVIAYYAL